MQVQNKKKKNNNNQKLVKNLGSEIWKKIVTPNQSHKFYPYFFQILK
jgi:hypothetical protein